MFLISGGGSQLGLNTARELVSRGHKVVLTTRRQNDALSAKVAQESGGMVTVEILDLMNMYQICNLMARYEFKTVIHTATAHVHAYRLSDNYPSYGMIFNMLEAATSFNVERFILANSFVVYAGVKPPFREDQALPVEFVDMKVEGSVPNPSLDVTVKRTVEAVTLDYGVAPHRPRPGKQMETVSLRFPAQIGPFYNSMFNPIARMVHAYAKKRPELMEGRALRGFSDQSYSPDNAEAIAVVAEAKVLPHRVYNVSSDIHVTGREALEAFYRVAPDAKAILKMEVADQPHEPNGPRMDISRIREDLGWAPKYNLDSMLADYIAWVKANDY